MSPEIFNDYNTAQEMGFQNPDDSIVSIIPKSPLEELRLRLKEKWGIFITSEETLPYASRITSEADMEVVISEIVDDTVKNLY
jgi:hypothetical protein